MESKIKASELRLNNWIKNKYGDIGQADLVWLRLVSEGEYFEPIELTDDILTKCGWVWNEECNSYEKYPDGDVRLNISKPSELSGKRTVFNHVLRAKIADVTYLHQLQNLYFALTNTELVIKL